MGQKINEQQIKNEDWITPTLINGWSHYGGGYTDVKYMKDAMGFVHITGLVKNGSAGTAFVLPVGYRPELTEIHATINASGVTRIDIGDNGNVEINSRFNMSNSYVSLAGITFRAEN